MTDIDNTVVGQCAACWQPVGADAVRVKVGENSLLYHSACTPTADDLSGGYAGYLARRHNELVSAKARILELQGLLRDMLIEIEVLKQNAERNADEIARQRYRALSAESRVAAAEKELEAARVPLK